MKIHHAPCKNKTIASPNISYRSISPHHQTPDNQPKPTIVIHRIHPHPTAQEDQDHRKQRPIDVYIHPPRESTLQLARATSFFQRRLRPARENADADAAAGTDKSSPSSSVPRETSSPVCLRSKRAIIGFERGDLARRGSKHIRRAGRIYSRGRDRDSGLG